LKHVCLDQIGIPPAAAARASLPLTRDSVWKHVERVLASPIFARSERLCRFVRFSIDLTLEGRAEELNESLLGVHVFDRGAAFDPTDDAIVRVEAHRLRLKLSQYYKNAGRNDRLLIRYPTGRYVPVFRERGRTLGNTNYRVSSV
jgi:hypothetical protein